MVKGKITVLEECGSTNTEAADRTLYNHGDAVVALRQTAGRGQRGRRWDSAPGENLTFSMVFEPRFLPAARQFLLSEAVALAVADTLVEYGIEARIKWTNDIYVGDLKICGMLLEHNLDGGCLSRTVAGIGLNVNQSVFPGWVSNPCSMFSVTEAGYDTAEVLDVLYANLMGRYAMLESGCSDRIIDEYNSILYRRGKPSRFFIPGSGEVIGTLTGVENDGTLLVETGGELCRFLFKEIEFII